MKVVTYLSQSFVAHEVEHVFGVSGANIEELFHAVATTPSLKAVLAKHEASAVTMAMGSVKAGKPLGVVLTTSGGGAFNTIPSLAEAYNQRTPLLVCMGQVAQFKRGTGAFQESDGTLGTPNLPAVLQGVTTACFTLERANDLPSILEKVYTLLMQEQCGPVVLLLPQDLLSATLGTLEYVPPLIAPDNHCRGELPHSWEKSVVIVGSGIHTARLENEWSSLCETLTIPLVATPDARGLVPSSHPYYAGCIGAMGNPSAHEALEAAEQIIVLGTALPQLVQFGWSASAINKKIYFSGAKLRGALQGISMGNSLAQIIAGLKELPRLSTPAIPHYVTFSVPASNAYAQYATILSRAFETLPGAVFSDAGNCGCAMAHLLEIPKECFFDISLFMGGMGYTFGAAIGYAFTTRKPTWIMAGDGAFFMLGLEIHTAIEAQLPLTVILFNNQGHAMCETREEHFFCSPAHYNSFATPLRGVGLSTLFEGLQAYDAYTPEELAHCLMSSDGTRPRVVMVHLSVDTVVPFLPFFETEISCR